MKIILTVLLSLQLFSAAGQTEFLTTVNPATGTFSIIDSLPGVNFIYMDATAYDKNNKRYVFRGIDFGGNARLYCIDAISGAILSQPLFSLNVGELQYDNSSNILFGLHIDNSIGKMFLISIDIATAGTVIIDTLPVVGFSGGATYFDETNQDFVLKNSGSFYSMDVNTTALTVTTAAANYSVLQYDNVSAKLYGLLSSTSLYVVEINPATGTYIPVATLTTTGYSSSVASFDELNNVYTVQSGGSLLSVNVNTGIMLSNPTFPVIPAGQNIVELHYDNSDGVLYALHWGSVTTGMDDYVFDSNALQLNQSENAIDFILKDNTNQIKSIEIYSVLGSKVKVAIENNQTISTNEFSDGVYFYRVITNNNIPYTGKFIVK